SGRAARSAAPRECHTGSLPADISPAPPGLWADGRTSGCTRGTFLHTQKTDPVLPPASEGSVPAASDPLSLPCAASVASSPPPAFSFILPQQMIFSHFVNNPTLSRGKRPALGMGSVVIYPPSPPIFLHSREWAVKGATHRRSRRLALDGLPRLCYFQRRGGGIYPPEPPPFPG